MHFKLQFGPLIRQYIIVIIVNLSVLCVGLGLAWPSPVLVKLRNETESVLARPITVEEGSWIVSIGFISSGISNFLVGYLVDRIGRKYCIVLSYLPRLVSCAFLTFGTEVWMLLVGRFISGIADTFVFNVVPMYASEVANKEIRGSLGTLLQIFCSLGIVIMLCMGPFTPYFILNVIVVCIVIVTFIPVLFVPDSPYYLYSKGRTPETLEVLKFLRGSEALASEELKEYSLVDKNLKVSKIQLLKNRVFLKALGIVIVLGAGGQLVGFNAITYYLQTVLESTETSVKPEIASVVIGLIQLTASFFTTVVTDRFGRKPILTTTLAGMAVGMLGVGLFFQVKGNQHSVAGFWNFVPLISLILVVFCFSAGPGSLIWILVAELFDGPSRSTGVVACLLTSSVFVFITTKCFELLILTIGVAPTYWLFGVNSLVFCLFIRFCVPETKGKSFSEIQMSMGGTGDNVLEKEKREKC